MDVLREFRATGSIPFDFKSSSTFILLAVSVFVLVKILYRNYKLPPGPIGIPFLGYFPFLKENSFESLGKKYGNIYSVRIGPQTLLVVFNDYETVKNILSNSLSLDRATEATDFLHNVGFGSMNGTEWQEQRRSCRYLTRDLGIGKNKWEDQVQERAEELVEKVRPLKGKPVDIGKDLHAALLNNIFSFLLGENDVMLKNADLVLKYSEISLTELSPSSIVNSFPGLRSLFIFLRIGSYHERKQVVYDFLDILKNKVKEHKSIPNYQDFISLYCEKQMELSKQGKKHFFSEYNLIGNLNVFVLGSGDTIYSSLMWMFRLMAKYPEIQKRIQRELDDATERNIKLIYGNRAEIPYTFAFMLETERYASVVPLSTARKAVDDIHIGNYVIPKGTWLSGNLRALHYDTQYWDEPEKFNPLRFLSEDGTKILTNKKSYLPFSLGKRNCPGETIAWTGLMSFFSTVLQRFEIRPKQGEDVRFDVVPGLVLHLKPQELCYIERNHSAI